VVDLTFLKDETLQPGQQGTAVGVTGTITFKPNDKCPGCKLVKLVQIVQAWDNAKTQHVWTDVDGKNYSEREKIKSATGWVVDMRPELFTKGDGKASIYYRDSWANPDKSQDGSNTEDASLWDRTTGKVGATMFFETCARCADNDGGANQNGSPKYLGCVKWGWKDDLLKGTTLTPISGADAPSGNFDSSISSFNKYYNTNW
jgi:hypothetical protein